MIAKHLNLSLFLLLLILGRFKSFKYRSITSKVKPLSPFLRPSLSRHNSIRCGDKETSKTSLISKVPWLIGAALLSLGTPISTNQNIHTPNSLDLIQCVNAAESNSDGSKAVKLSSGVQYYDVKVGETGPVVEEGRTVQLTWVLRRSNGYYVDSNVDNEPFIYKVGNLRKAIKGVDEVKIFLKIFKLIITYNVYTIGHKRNESWRSEKDDYTS